MDPEPDVDIGNMRVLVVDDLPINRELLEAQLRRWNLNHQSAASGVEALTRLRHAARLGESFDVVLVDYFMPDMNGEQLALAILAEEELRSTPMVMLTAKASNRDEVNRLLRVGFFDVISKPVIRPGQQLLDSLRRAVNRRVSEAATVSLAPLVEGPGFRDHPVRWRVLLAEDNLINQRLETRLLQREGCQVDIAMNGGEAVKKAIAFHYDVIFMDCQMPEMDGLETAAALRSLRLETPIVALTANAMPGDRARCMAAGMNDYISKPVKVTELRGVLERWASVRAMQTGNPLPA